jgi:hypothetical protein
MIDLRQAAETVLEALEMNALGFNNIRKIELAIEVLESALAKPDETETLKRCLFQMQEAAKALVQSDIGISRGVWSDDANDFMQYPERSDLIGGKTDCVEEPANFTTDVVEPETPIHTQQALNQLPDATKMIDKVCIKYWRQVTMESGRWATTDSMSRDTAEKLLSDEYREAFPWGEIVEAKLKEKNNE